MSYLDENKTVIDYIVLNDGNKIDCKKTNYVLITTADKAYKSDDGLIVDSDLNYNFNVKNFDVFQALSNNCFLMSVVISYMGKYNLSFEQAYKKHMSFLEEERKKRGNI